MHVLFEHLFHVELWWFGLKRDHGGHRVFRGTVSSHLGDGLIENVWACFLKCNGFLNHAEALLVPLLGEIVAVVEEAITGPDSNSLTALEVLGAVVLDWAHVHVRVVSEDWGLGQLLASQKHVERVTAVIGFVNLLNLNGLIA